VAVLSLSGIIHSFISAGNGSTASFISAGNRSAASFIHSFISVSAGVSVGAGAGTLSRDHARVGWG
jgi:hypothetical protein